MKERRAIAAVVALSIFLSALVYMLSLKSAHDNRRLTCDVISIAISIPAIKPVNPQQEPSMMRSYQNYLKFKELDITFGC